VRAEADRHTIVEHQDLVGGQDRRDALSHDEHRRVGEMGSQSGA
jgi:hypothetical protein